jgi:hypothetical protein
MMIYSSINASDMEDNLKTTSDTARAILDTLRKPEGVLENTESISNRTLHQLLPLALSIVAAASDMLEDLKAGNVSTALNSLINEAHQTSDWITRFRASLSNPA